MIRPPPRSTRTDTRFPYTTLFRSGRVDEVVGIGLERHAQLWRERLFAGAPFAPGAAVILRSVGEIHEREFSLGISRAGGDLQLLGAAVGQIGKPRDLAFFGLRIGDVAVVAVHRIFEIFLESLDERDREKLVGSDRQRAV